MEGSPQEQAPRAGPKAAGRRGKHQPTQPVAEGAGWGYEGCNTWVWLWLNQGQGPTSVDTPMGSHRNGAGKNDCASSLEADCTDALQRKRQERCSFRRRRGRGNSKNVKKLGPEDNSALADLPLLLCISDPLSFGIINPLKLYLS